MAWFWNFCSLIVCDSEQHVNNIVDPNSKCGLIMTLLYTYVYAAIIERLVWLRNCVNELLTMVGRDNNTPQQKSIVFFYMLRGDCGMHDYNLPFVFKIVIS